MKDKNLKALKVFLLVSIRLCLGFIFFWAFLDKFFGLGFATAPENAWMNGGSPTFAYLSHAVSGPFGGIYHAMAGHPVVDALFMAGLGLIGLSLILGMGLRVAGLSGMLLSLLLWSSHLPPENNPIVDEHILYALLFSALAISDAGHHLGLGKWWEQTKLVKKWSWLK